MPSCKRRPSEKEEVIQESGDLQSLEQIEVIIAIFSTHHWLVQEIQEGHLQVHSEVDTQERHEVDHEICTYLVAFF